MNLNYGVKKLFRLQRVHISLHYSWIILIITFLVLLMASAIRSMPGAIIISWEKFFGWKRTEITFALAINLFLYGLCGPFVAAMLELYGIRRIMTLSLLLLAIGSGLSTWMNALWQMNLLWGIVIGIGTGGLSSVVGPIIANRWFFKHQGVVVGIFGAAGATGQLIFLPLFAKLLSTYDWQTAVRIITALIMMIVLLVMILMRDRPSDIGLLPYGASDMDTVPVSLNENPLFLIGHALKAAILSKKFWLLSSSFFVCGATSTGLIATHFILACNDIGISEMIAASMLSVAGLFNIFGVTVSGWLSDRFDNRWLLFWIYFLRGISLLFLPFLLGSNLWYLLFFIVFYGLDWIATVPPTVRLTRDTFGKQGGIVFGWIMVIHQLGAALAAFGGGVLHTEFGNYRVTFILAGLLCFMASGLVMKISNQNKKSNSEKPY